MHVKKLMENLIKNALKIFPILLIYSCAHAPKVTICLSDPPAWGMQCSDGSDLTPAQRKKIMEHLAVRENEPKVIISGRNDELVEYLKSLGTFMPYEDSANYVCMSPDDTRKLFEYCRNK